MSWRWIIAAGWAGMLVASVLHHDPKDWLVVREVTVFDALEGYAPSMRVDRTIRQPFRGSWLVQVNRIGDDGRASAACMAAGQNYYSPDNVLPANLDLNWWTWPAKCHLEPGRYVIDTVWTIRPPSLKPMEVAATSNAFIVRPRVADVGRADDPS